MQNHQANTAPWHQLVIEAEAKLGANLDQETESYLVFMLMRHLRQPELVSSIFALALLESLQKHGKARLEALQQIGDQCLIFAGFFPEQARRRCVSQDYFVHMGRNAYGELWRKPIFVALTRHFVLLADILSQIRANNPLLRRQDLPELQERWESTGSRFAYRQMLEQGLLPIHSGHGARH